MVDMFCFTNKKPYGNSANNSEDGRVPAASRITGMQGQHYPSGDSTITNHPCCKWADTNIARYTLIPFRNASTQTTSTDLSRLIARKISILYFITCKNYNGGFPVAIYLEFFLRYEDALVLHVT